MKRRNFNIISVFFFLFLTLGINLHANSAIEARTTIDWQNSLIKISITAPLPPQIDVIPEAKILAENTINDSVNIIIQKAMEYILLNSQTNVYEQIKKDLKLTSVIQGFSDLKYKTKTILTPDLLNLETEYQIPLYPDFCKAFVTHSRPKPVPKRLAYVPTQKFTGIVIYIPEKLPVFGEKITSEYNPCLFPKIYSSSGELLFNSENMEPSLLVEQGAVHYVDHLEKVPYEFSGFNPLYIKATALFGQNKTDIVIPQYLANQISYSANNRSLLQEGKITIVCSDKNIISKLFFTN